MEFSFYVDERLPNLVEIAKDLVEQEAKCLTLTT